MAITRYRSTGNLFRPFFDDLMSPMGTFVRAPETDVIERENEIQVVSELPGMRADDIDISLENDVLTINGEKREEREEGGEKDTYHLRSGGGAGSAARSSCPARSSRTRSRRTSRTACSPSRSPRVRRRAAAASTSSTRADVRPRTRAAPRAVADPPPGRPAGIPRRPAGGTGRSDPVSADLPTRVAASRASVSCSQNARPREPVGRRAHHGLTLRVAWNHANTTAITTRSEAGGLSGGGIR